MFIIIIYLYLLKFINIYQHLSIFIYLYIVGVCEINVKITFKYTNIIETFLYIMYKTVFVKEINEKV